MDYLYQSLVLVCEQQKPLWVIKQKRNLMEDNGELTVVLGRDGNGQKRKEIPQPETQTMNIP